MGPIEGQALYHWNLYKITGDLDSRNFLVNLFSEMARRLAGSIYNSDELQCEASFLLLRNLELARTRLKDSNLTAYLFKSIKRGLLKYLRENRVIRIPNSTFYLHKLTDREVLSVDVDPYLVDFCPFNTREFVEPIYKLCRNELERDIVALRIQGWNDCEIGWKMGVSTKWVNTLRNRLEREYAQKEGIL